jgi:hypothetical protein
MALQTRVLDATDYLEFSQTNLESLGAATVQIIFVDATAKQGLDSSMLTISGFKN